MGGFKVLVQLVGGVEKQYFIPINDADGDNGLLDDDANIERLEHLVGGQVTDYWWSHASGTGDQVLDSEIFNANVAELNGTSQYLTLADSDDWFFTGAFTISIRAKVTTLSADQCLWIHHESGTDFMTLALLSDGTLDFAQFNSNNSVASMNFPSGMTINQWHTLTLTFEMGSGLLALYRDTTLLGTTAYNGMYNLNGSMYLGAYGLISVYYLSGQLEGFKVWDQVGLTSEEVTELHNDNVDKCYDQTVQKQALVAYLPLYNHEGFVGQELIDQSPSGNNAINVNSTPFTGTAQIECEPYIISSPLFFYTKDVSPIALVIVTTSGTATVLSVGSTEGTVVSNSPTFNYPYPSVEHLVEVTNLDPLDITQINIASAGVNEISPVGSLSNLEQFRAFTNNITNGVNFTGHQNLWYLHVGGNNFTSLGDLGAISTLERCILYSNNLTDIGTFENNSSIIEIRLSDNPNFNYGSNRFLSCTALREVFFNNCANSSVSTIDQIIIDLDGNGISNGTLNLSGGTNATPSGASSVALAGLISKSWTVTTN